MFDTVAIPEDGLKAGGSLDATMRLGLFLIVGILLAGCGADTPPPKPQKPVQLSVSAPSDTAIVQSATAQVSGTVSPPGARVKVQGHLAQVSGNSFTSTVNLAQGPNVIDVAATARGRATALTAFRVTRDERVAVPELVALSLDDATKQAQERDLKVSAERGGGFLDPLVPRGIHVCDQSPAPGKQVQRGSTIKLLVARSC